MRPNKSSSRPVARTHSFETVEARQLMAADLGAIVDTFLSQQSPVQTSAVAGNALSGADMRISLEDIQLVQFQQTISTAAAGNNWTDVEYVRNTYGLNGKGQTVAIIDSGIAYDHISLGAGYGKGKKVVGGYDFAENDNNPYDDGPAGFHGTHVAGIVGSTHATYTGVAPGVDLVALRVFDDEGAGYFSYVEQALQWVYANKDSFANPITTVNLSLGTDWNSNTTPNWAMLEDEFAQLETAGIFISVAAGNSFEKFKKAGLSYPAVSPYVVPVMAHDSNGLLSYFSQRGSTAIAAPGRSIMSTVPDHAFGADGVKNDFGSASGTSMAAPYIAGVSALVRQAMEAFGHTNITQDQIYQRIRNTADTFRDNATNANYLRVNVTKAISSLSGADLHGNTAANGFALGTWNGTAVSGKFNTLTDKDYFTFTAGQTGNVQLKLNAVGGGTTTWMVGASTANGKTLSLNVVAGQTYTFGIGSSAIGSYTITTNFSGGSSNGGTPGGGNDGSDNGGNTSGNTTAWGTMTVRQVENLAVNGTANFTFTAGRTAYFTLDGTQSQGSAVRLEVLNAKGDVIRETQAVNGQLRINFNARQGDNYTLRISGNSTDIDLSMINILARNGSGVEVFGTAGANQISILAERQLMIIDGVRSSYQAFDSVKINGGGGEDSVSVLGDTRATENVSVNTKTLQIAGGPVKITAEDVEMYILKFQDEDSSTVYDSRGNDVIWVADGYVAIKGADFRHRLHGFGYNVVNATAGGNDAGYFYESAGMPKVSVIYGTITTATNAGKMTIARSIERAFYVSGEATSSLSAFAGSTAASSLSFLASTTAGSSNSPEFASGGAVLTTDQVVSDFAISTKNAALEDLQQDDEFEEQAAAILDSITELSQLVDKYRSEEASEEFACYDIAKDEVLTEGDLTIEMFMLNEPL